MVLNKGSNEIQEKISTIKKNTSSKIKQKSEQSDKELIEYVFTALILSGFASLFKEEGWGRQRFVGLQDILWTWSSGPKLDFFTSNLNVGTIWDVQWHGITEKIVVTTNVKESTQVSASDINLYLAALLVTGLSPQPAYEDYFKIDPEGIFGSVWMQQHFSLKKWNFIRTHTHIDPDELLKQININIKSCWNLHQVVVIDEMMVPFHGRWAHRQYIKGKSHNTGP